MVNLEWYRSFVATYQAGTVTAAAAQRFLTQPTLSQHIAALESALKTTLFERKARRMLPTLAAQQLYPKVIASIERLEAIEHSPLQQASAPWLRLGAPITYFTEQVLRPQLVSQMQNLRWQVMLGETAGLLDMLKNNELDLVIATQKISIPRLHYVLLQHERFDLVAPTSLRLQVESLEPAQVEAWLSRQTWISYSAQMPIIRRYWQSAFRKRPEFDPQIIIPDLYAILRSIELGLGMSILPNYLLHDGLARQSVYIPWRPQNEVTNALYLVCQQERAKQPLISLAMASLLESCQN